MFFSFFWKFSAYFLQIVGEEAVQVEEVYDVGGGGEASVICL